MEGIDYESRDSTNFARANLKRIRNSIDAPFQKRTKVKFAEEKYFWTAHRPRIRLGTEFASADSRNKKRVVDGMHGRSGIERSKIGHDTVTQKPGPLDIPPR